VVVVGYRSSSTRYGTWYGIMVPVPYCQVCTRYSGFYLPVPHVLFTVSKGAGVGLGSGIGRRTRHPPQSLESAYLTHTYDLLATFQRWDMGPIRWRRSNPFGKVGVRNSHAYCHKGITVRSFDAPIIWCTKLLLGIDQVFAIA
jgi:hypothetical protein